MRTRRSIRLAVILASLLLPLIAAGPLAAQRQPLPTRLAAPASAHPLGRLPGNQRVDLALTLQLRNESGLENLLKQIYDPASPLYHHFLTVQQFADDYGPTASDEALVVEFLESYGLTVTRTTPNRLVIDASGRVSQIESAFNIRMQTYQHPTEHRTYYAPDVEPSVEPGIPLQGIAGLNNFEPPRPIGLERHSRSTKVRTNTTGSGPGGDFLGSDMRAAYAPGVTLNGAGQVVGLFEFGPYNLSDVQAYFSTINQSLNVPIVNELLDGVNGICGAGCDDGEEVIDMEQSISMAPGLSAVIVYEGTNDVDMFNQMATDNLAKQLSCSFGWLPADPSSDEPIFEEFAAQGQNLFVASGDSGAYYGNPTDCQNFSDLNGCIFYPADDPDITAAGGTDLTTNGPGGTWASETGWNGSGGGYSTNGFTIPSYQVPVINGSNQGSTTLRNIPDLAAEANTDNYYCANGGCFEGVGGTSLSAPRWAGFLSMANEQINGPLIGFLNPTIYSIGQGSNYDSDFHDITSGNNFNSGSPNMFSAVVGYDLVTGWGSPNGQNLLNALGPAYTGANYSMSASPGTISISQGEMGTSMISVSALNGFTGTVNLAVAIPGSPTGITASVNPTTIMGSGSATLTVNTTNQSPGGNFVVVVTGTSEGLTHAAYVTVALPGFSIVAPTNAFVAQGGRALNTVTINSINGFSGSVNLSAAGAPNGVFTVLSPPTTSTTSTLGFKAVKTAPTGFTTVTITGTSGNLTQTAAVDLAVSAAFGTGGLGTPVDLSSAYNVTGIYTDGATFSSSGGLDGGGSAYSEKQLTMFRILSGTQFDFGPPNQPDAVSGTGEPIALASGRFSKLRMMATGVNGAQSNQAIIVTYTDGSTAEYGQSFSDWYTPGNYPGEKEGVAMPYRDIYDGTTDNRTFNLYNYTFLLNSSKTVQSITLPDNRDLCVLAITLQ